MANHLPSVLHYYIHWLYDVTAISDQTSSSALRKDATRENGIFENETTRDEGPAVSVSGFFWPDLLWPYQLHELRPHLVVELGEHDAKCLCPVRHSRIWHHAVGHFSNSRFAHVY